MCVCVGGCACIPAYMCNSMFILCCHSCPSCGVDCEAGGGLLPQSTEGVGVATPSGYQATNQHKKMAEFLRMGVLLLPCETTWNSCSPSSPRTWCFSYCICGVVVFSPFAICYSLPHCFQTVVSSVVCLLFICYVPVCCLLSVSYLPIYCLPSVCHLSPVCLSTVCCLSVYHHSWYI